MASRLSGQTPKTGVVFFLFKSLWELRDKRNLKKVTILTRKLRRHIRILIYIPNVGGPLSSMEQIRLFDVGLKSQEATMKNVWAH